MFIEAGATSVVAPVAEAFHRSAEHPETRSVVQRVAASADSEELPVGLAQMDWKAVACRAFRLLARSQGLVH